MREDGLFACPADAEDVIHVAMHLREADYNEVLAATGVDPARALLQFYLEGSTQAVFADVGPVALFGIEPYHGTTGIAWMVATDKFFKHRWEIVRRGREVLAELMADKGLTHITNLIDRRNVAHIKWLRSLGAEFTGQTIERGGTTFEVFVCAHP